jgi:hypothetical protein
MQHGYFYGPLLSYKHWPINIDCSLSSHICFRDCIMLCNCINCSYDLLRKRKVEEVCKSGLKGFIEVSHIASL